MTKEQLLEYKMFMENLRGDKAVTRPILRQKKIDKFSNLRRNFFASKSAEMKILLCKWHMAIKKIL